MSLLNNSTAHCQTSATFAETKHGKRPNINQGFFIAKKQTDGSPGRPVGNEEGAIMLFEDLEVSTKVKDSMASEHGPLSIFRVNLVLAGEVLF